MKKVATNIKWDTDGDMEALSDLPSEMEIPVEMRDEDEISDFLSKATGFCHNGFVLQNVITEEEVLAMIKSKSITYQWIGLDKDESNAADENAIYFVALCQTKHFVEKSFPVYIRALRAYKYIDEEIAHMIHYMYAKGRLHIDEDEILDDSFISRRKILFTHGMSHDQMLIITDAPKEEIEKWCRRYKMQMEDGGRCELFDTLKVKYYVKELLDSEIDDEEAFEVLGCDESYDFSNYTLHSSDSDEHTKEDLYDEVCSVLSKYEHNNPSHQRGIGEEMLYEILSKVKKNWEFLTQ